MTSSLIFRSALIVLLTGVVVVLLRPVPAAAFLLRHTSPESSRVVVLQARAGGTKTGWSDSLEGGKNFLDTVFNRLDRERKKEDEKSEEDRMLEYLDTKPWRANKVRHLPITYRPSKESWRERYRDPSDDTIYLYSQPKFKPISASARLDEVWNWPWMWTKTKAERLGWIHKYFYVECERMSVQEHMELDAFFSEFDMPTRWGILRMKEFDVLNAFFLNLCFWTDFNGIMPTDLGLRPDGTVKTCAVQFHNCISSSNSPGDTDHYAPPFKWDRAKSPEQAYDDIKRVYADYPKRGLKWSSGWIDRGGWDPQQFGGQYFYAQAHSLAFHYTDDIEMNLDIPNREVQFRSSTRLGQADWDVERLRYNQFVRMLNKKGGWEVAELPRLNWFSRTPFRWTELVLDKSTAAVERTANRASMLVPSIAAGGDTDGAAARAYEEVRALIMPALQPLFDGAGKVRENVILEPRVAATLQALDDFEDEIKGGLELGQAEVHEWVEKVLRLIPERFLPSSAVDRDVGRSIGDPDILESRPGAPEMSIDGSIQGQEQPGESKPWLLRDSDANSAPPSLEGAGDTDTGAQSLVEGVVETTDGAGPSSPFAQATKVKADAIAPGERRVLRKQLQSMQQRMALPQ